MEDKETDVSDFSVYPKQQCENLIHSENVDKATAIRIYQMYTTMLTDQQQTEASRNIETEQLKHELAMLNAAHAQKDDLDALTKRLTAVEGRVEKLEQDARLRTEALASSLSEINNQLSGLESRVLAQSGKRR